jgi:hypothetical protein
MIDQDFQVLFEELCENCLLRPIDVLLLKSKQSQYASQNKRNIFFSSLEKSVNKYDVYNFLSQFKGEKRVLLSPTNKVCRGDQFTLRTILSNLNLFSPGDKRTLFILLNHYTLK